MTPEAVVRALFAAYDAGDRAAAEPLVADGYVFSSPLDDRIDRAAYFERCFPTRGAFTSHGLGTVAANGDDVFITYDMQRADTGEWWRNAELHTVRDGQLVETQVFFGFRVEPS